MNAKQYSEALVRGLRGGHAHNAEHGTWTDESKRRERAEAELTASQGMVDTCCARIAELEAEVVNQRELSTRLSVDNERLEVDRTRTEYLLGALSIWAKGLNGTADEALARAREEWARRGEE